MSTDLTWKESVAQLVLNLIENTGLPTFNIDEVYQFEAQLKARFPENQHVREKIRQSLQKLVADGLLVRTQKGVYSANVESPELDVASAPVKLPEGATDVKQVNRIVRIRLRNTLLAIEMKKLYEYRCQVCRYAIPLQPTVYYAEGHHLRPLGGVHNGPDVAGNILVLCPNHHTMFDAGAVAIEPDSRRVIHCRPHELPQQNQLLIADWHKLDNENIEYHFTYIYKGRYLPYQADATVSPPFSSGYNATEDGNI